MKPFHSVPLCLVVAMCAHTAQAQDTSPAPATNAIASAPVVITEVELPPPAVKMDPHQQPAQDMEFDDYTFDVIVDHRRVLNGDYESLTQMTFSGMAIGNDFNSGGMFIGAGTFQLKRGSEADLVAHQPYFMEVGFVVRHYFTRPHVFFRPYVTANVSFFWMLWEFREPMPADDGHERNGSLKGMSGYAGAGLALRLNKQLSVFGEIGAGGVGLDEKTCSGLDNTFFDDFGYVGVKAGLSIAF